MLAPCLRACAWRRADRPSFPAQSLDALYKVKRRKNPLSAVFKPKHTPTLLFKAGPLTGDPPPLLPFGCAPRRAAHARAATVRTTPRLRWLACSEQRQQDRRQHRGKGRPVQLTRRCVCPTHALCVLRFMPSTMLALDDLAWALGAYRVVMGLQLARQQT